MARQVSSFIRSLQEEVAIKRTDPVFTNRTTGEEQSTDVIGGGAWSDFSDAEKIRAVVLPRTYRANTGVLIEDDNQYTANVTPPRSEIRVGDELVRSGDVIGQNDDQKLIINNIQIARDIQQLRLENRDQPIQ